jgi:hypothetical protein
MTPFSLDLLKRVLSLERGFRTLGEPAWVRPRGRAGLREAGQRIAWEAGRDHGPRIAALHGDGYDDAARKRVSRALARLEAAGLVRRWKAWGEKWERSNYTHVKTTEAGRRVAEGGGP